MHDLDMRALRTLYGEGSGAWTAAMIALTLAGGGWAAVALVPLLYYRRTRLFAWILSVSIAVQASLVWALKIAVGRVRPWVALGLPPPVGAPRDGSFPSGHAAGSFCVAAFLSVALPAVWRGSRGRARAVSAAAIAMAALVALSRVALGAHFPGDALAGAALGAIVGAAGGREYVRRAGRGAAGGSDRRVEGAPERG
jgi:undecaprenyl-diphosphatase